MRRVIGKALTAVLGVLFALLCAVLFYVLVVMGEPGLADFGADHGQASAVYSVWKP